MTPISDKPIIDKKVFTIKNIGAIILCVFSCSATWAALGSRQDKQEAISNLHEIRLDKQEAKDEELDNKIDKEVYNGRQLTYRITAAQQKQLDKLILGDQEHRLRYKYIEGSLKDVKEYLKDIKAGQQ